MCERECCGTFHGTPHRSTCEKYRGKKPIPSISAQAVVVDGITWFPVSQPPKDSFGWFLGAILPMNYMELTPVAINRWRKEFGTTKVWYNRGACSGWWEPDPHGHGNKELKDRITHWAELPYCPDI